MCWEVAVVTFEVYWSILMKRWHSVCMCLILVGGGALLVSLMIPPTYRSTALIQVAVHSSGNQSDINDLLASNQLVQTEAQLAISDPILQEVAKNHPELTLWQLENMTSSEPSLNTQLFELHVQDNDAKQAATLTNELATIFIAQQEKTQQQEDQNEQNQLQQEIDADQKQMDVVKNRLAGVSGSTYDNLEQQLTMLQQHNSQWQLALTQLELDEAQYGKFLLIVQPARPETNSVQPLVWLNTGVGCGVGFLLGLLLILVLEKVDQRVRSTTVIRQIVDWPVLSIVWRSREPDHFCNPGVQNINMDAYHMLRSRIDFAEVAAPLRYLLVTSALPREGKSTVAANLAFCMAIAGKNTLLIDGDFRRPVLHDKFALAPDKLGLSNALLACCLSEFQSSLLHKYQTSVDAKDISLEHYMHRVGVPHLRVMPSGPLPPDPSELFNASAVQRFFHALERSGADVVIFDASSVLETLDVALLASKVDGTIIVVDPKRLCKPQLYQVQVNLTQVGAHVVGYVMNKQRRYQRQMLASHDYHAHSVEPIWQPELEN